MTRAVKRILFPVLVLLAVTISAGCGGQKTSDGAATTVVVTQTVEETTESAPDATPDETTEDSSSETKPTVVRQVGGTGIDDGLAFRVLSIERVPEIQLDEFSDPPVARPVKGAKLIEAKVVVTNKGSVSVDPFCGGGGATLLDVNDRNFDSLSDIALDIPGNQVCGDELQPGFRDTYTLVFQTPESAKVAGIALWNGNSEEDFSGETYVVFQK
jgi:hypothetical protein